LIDNRIGRVRKPPHARVPSLVSAPPWAQTAGLRAFVPAMAGWG